LPEEAATGRSPAVIAEGRSCHAAEVTGEV
jgi:hypothetical protein